MKKLLDNPIKMVQAALCLFVVIAIGQCFIKEALAYMALGQEIAACAAGVVVFTAMLFKARNEKTAKRDNGKQRQTKRANGRV